MCKKVGKGTPHLSPLNKGALPAGDSYHNYDRQHDNMQPHKSPLEIRYTIIRFFFQQ
jgi:hypothetical protein